MQKKTLFFVGTLVLLVAISLLFSAAIRLIDRRARAIVQSEYLGVTIGKINRQATQAARYGVTR